MQVSPATVPTASPAGRVKGTRASKFNVVPPSPTAWRGWPVRLAGGRRFDDLDVFITQ